MFLIADMVLAMVLIENVLALLMTIEDYFHSFHSIHSNYNQNASRQHHPEQSFSKYMNMQTIENGNDGMVLVEDVLMLLLMMSIKCLPVT